MKRSANSETVSVPRSVVFSPAGSWPCATAPRMAFARRYRLLPSRAFNLRSCRRVCRQAGVVARRREEIDHLGVFAEPCLVLDTSRNDYDVALAADPLFAAEAELHFPLFHAI